MTEKPSAVRRNSVAGRRTRAVESFGCAATAIGHIEPGMSLFAVTRGQWSMIDAILHCLDEVGPASVSCWTWTVAEYEVEVLARLRRDSRITSGRLVIDYGARNKNAGIIREWQDTFGPKSVRYVINHAKIALIESASGLRLCLRGSMNLNLNPRFEQFDLSEGGADFDMVREIEESLPWLTDGCSGSECYEASKVSSAFPQETLQLFPKLKVWAK
jgi:hypothetical protein